MGDRLSDSTRQALSDPRHPAYDPERLAELEAAEAAPSPEQTEAVMRALLDELSFEDLVMAGIQELFERVITIENVIGDVVRIIEKNAMNPATMAQELRELLDVPDAATPQEG